jgi:hypothetical protein
MRPRLQRILRKAQDKRDREVEKAVLQTITSQGIAQYKLAKAQAKQRELEAEAGLAGFLPPIAAIGVAAPIAANNNDDGEAMDVC